MLNKTAHAAIVWIAAIPGIVIITNIQCGHHQNLQYVQKYNTIVTIKSLKGAVDKTTTKKKTKLNCTR